MSDNSPYATPNSELGVDQEVTEFNDAGIFSLSGRIGRLRYLAYSSLNYILTLVIVFVLSVVLGVIFAALGIAENSDSVGSNIFFLIVIVLVYIYFFFYAFVFSRRRLNDIGWSGWWSVLYILPIINLLFVLVLMFKAGDIGTNKYGYPSLSNTLWIKIVGLVFPILLIISMIGILASIAIPQYAEYVKKAEAAAQSQQQ